jgi:hypothetical protein
MHASLSFQASGTTHPTTPQQTPFSTAPLSDIKNLTNNSSYGVYFCKYRVMETSHQHYNQNKQALQVI